jgi:RNA polymerase sigma factor (sigma-70 family)
MMQRIPFKEWERKYRAAKAQRPKLLTFSDLGEKLERIHSPMELKGDGSWVHYSERLVIEPLEDRLIREEENALLHEALNRLPPEDRELVTRRYGIEGLSHTLTELARMRGCTPEAIRVKIEKIKRELKKRLLRRL